MMHSTIIMVSIQGSKDLGSGQGPTITQMKSVIQIESLFRGLEKMIIIAFEARIKYEPTKSLPLLLGVKVL